MCIPGSFVISCDKWETKSNQFQCATPNPGYGQIIANYKTSLDFDVKSSKKIGSQNNHNSEPIFFGQTDHFH